MLVDSTSYRTAQIKIDWHSMTQDLLILSFQSLNWLDLVRCRRV